MASAKENNKNLFNAPPFIRVTDYDVQIRSKSKYPIPIRTCEMDLPGLGTASKKVATPKPFKFQPIRWRDMDLPELKSKPKTPISKPTKSTVSDASNKAKTFTPKQKSSCKTSYFPENGEKPRRTVRKQLWSVKKNENRLSIKMKPEKRLTLVSKSIIIPKSVKKLDDMRPLLDLEKYEKNPNIFKIPTATKNKFTPSKKTKNAEDSRASLEEFIRRLFDEQNKKVNTRINELVEKFDEQNKTINKRFNELAEKIEKLELKCNCHLQNNKISTPPKPKNNRFEILEQKLNRESPMTDELSLSDTESPIVKRDIHFLINDKTDIKKSFSTSNLAQKTKKSVNFTSTNDICSSYEEIRSNISYLCTPKNTTKVKNLMTPSVKENKQKLVSRTVQKQLLMLDDK